MTTAPAMAMKAATAESTAYCPGDMPNCWVPISEKYGMVEA